MANSSINLVSLDVDTIKENLKTYLASQDIFQDYDFEGSNMSVLLELLSYNTYLNAFYLNMNGNEMFLDSALLRDSVVSHAKELNYLPRSFRSSYANVNITVTDPEGANTEYSTVLIPKGTSFTGRSGAKNFTFVTDTNISTTGSNGVFSANDVLIYEGDYTSDIYTVNYNDPARYLITNKTVDTNSITVAVIENNGANTFTYTLATSLFGLDSTSKVFFLQAAENNTYEVVFGDGVIGRKPLDRAAIIIQYRSCNGELPNGIRSFVSDGAIDGLSNISIVVNSAATGGGIPETVESIKFNAPRAFTTQERVVTADDYATILSANFSEINTVYAYGGEEAIPPQYGKVYVAVDLKTADALPPSKREEYRRFVKQRSPLSIDPVFVDPFYTYIKVDSTVKYNINETSLTTEDIKILVESAISNYNSNNLDGFNKTLYFSKFITAIDAAHSSIVSNDTEILAVKSFSPTIGAIDNYSIDFGLALRNDIGQIESYHDEVEYHIISSSEFIYNGIQCFFEDDGNGILRIATQEEDQHSTVLEIGTVDYDTGVVTVSSFNPDAILGHSEIYLYGATSDKNITSQRNVILSIRDEDVNVLIEQVRV